MTKCVTIMRKGEPVTIAYKDYNYKTMKSNGITYEGTPTGESKIEMPVVESVVEEAPTEEETTDGEGLLCGCGKLCASALGLISHKRACDK